MVRSRAHARRLLDASPASTGVAAAAAAAAAATGRQGDGEYREREREREMMSGSVSSASESERSACKYTTTTPPMVELRHWIDAVQSQNLSTTDMDALVMNYLIVEGYKDAAEKFQQSSGVQPSIPLDSIDVRMHIRREIERGNIAGAIQKANIVNPTLLEKNKLLHFHLLQQQLVEIIACKDLERALLFAQEEVAPRAAGDQACIAELEQSMALFAFEDVHKSPLSELVAPARRCKVASELNAALLQADFQATEPRLQSLLKRLMWAQELLATRMEFPRILDVTTAAFVTKSLEHADAFGNESNRSR